jgi:large subunit ribosomal protein L21
MSRSLLRSVLELRTPVTQFPGTFVPAQARFFQNTASKVPPPNLTDSTTTKSDEPLNSGSVSGGEASSNSSVAPATLPESVQTLLPILAAQPSHFITTHIHGRPYLVTPGDQIRLPFKMPGVVPGDVLRLNRASNIGSRDYTLQGAPYIDERLFECRAVVTGTESEPMRIKEKTKRRNRRIKTVKSKHRYTILRIQELKINSPEEIEQ